MASERPNEVFLQKCPFLLFCQPNPLIYEMKEDYIFNYMEYLNLLRIAMEEMVPSTPYSREEKTDPHVTAKGTVVIDDYSDDLELALLSEAYGALEDGKAISVSLQDLLVLLPRKRKRRDAYNTLTAKLKRMGVTLNITANNINKLYENGKRKSN